MLNVALVGLLAGSLLTAPGGDDDKKDKKADAPESVVIVGDEAQEPILADTWALGRSDNASPIKLWIEGGWGQAGEVYGPDGEAMDPSVGGGAIVGGGADIVSTRALVGAQVNPINFDRFSIGLGAVLTAAKNEVKGTGGQFSGAEGQDFSLESDFSVQNIKFFAEAKGRTLGIHGGYLLDLGDEQEFNELGIPTDLSRSDNRDAIQIGADFDYPANNVRIFGAIDHFILLENEDVYGTTDGAENAFGEEGDGIWNFLLGAGVRFGPAEIGAAAQIVARDRQPVERNGLGTAGTTEDIGGYVSSIAPYLKLSPSGFPASIYVKGGVMDEYNTYGLGIDGSNGPKPTMGVTAGLSIGFN